MHRVPPFRQTPIPSNKALTFGTVTITMSAPIPSVTSLTFSAKLSLWGFIAKSAPNRFATSSLYLTKSLTMIWLAPRLLENMAWMIPDGPAPMMTTVSPG
ncbi:MAG: hypothetical protein AOA66_0304 [Candidatus Bathyarchaeota archaeon BA2]|nr:MAG: hypothetical protein AOA66_0304 [Candidatus Bathyarchaeota archaeon BA2]